MKVTSKRSLKNRLTMIIILSSTIPLLLLVFFSLQYMTHASQANLSGRLHEITDLSTKVMGQTISNQMNELRAFGDQVQVLDEEDIHRKMYQYLRGNESMVNLYYIKTDGTVIGTDETPILYQYPKYQNWGIYRNVHKQKDPVFYPNLERYSDRFQNAYSIIYPIYNESRDETGYVIMDVSTEYIQGIFNRLKGTAYGSVQFIITTQSDSIIYNDSVFRSPISFLQNVFRYDRVDTESSEDIRVMLEDMTLVTSTLDEHGLSVYGMIPNHMIKSQLAQVSVVFSLMIIGTAIISAILGYQATKGVSRPILSIVEKVQKNNPELKELSIDGKRDELEELEVQFDAMIENIEIARINDKKKQEMLRVAEIKSLMSQINPHFLNNTLDSIKWKAKLKGDEEIAAMVSQLGVLLKASMNTKQFVSVAEELEFISSYINIQKNRYGNKLECVIDVQEDALNLKIPKLMIQPIVENAIVHGIEPLNRKGQVQINIWCDDRLLYISVSDDGVGSKFDYEDIEQGTSIGLKNVNNRLKLHYGEDYSIHWESIPNEGTTVFLVVPHEGGNFVCFD